MKKHVPWVLDAPIGIRASLTDAPLPSLVKC